MIRLQVRAIHQKRGPGLNFAVRQRRRLEIADQVTGARRRVLGPGHPGVEPGDTHFEIALVLFEDRQIAERRQLAVRLPARHVLAARHEVDDIVGEEIEPLPELALVEQPSLPDVERHQLEPQRLLRCRRHRVDRDPCALRRHRIAARGWARIETKGWITALRPSRCALWALLSIPRRPRKRPSRRTHGANPANHGFLSQPSR